jgi:lysophospholipase L1-like esterase
MQQVLVYSDSLSWGIVPGTRSRLPFDRRWPGVLENNLTASGLRVRIIEDCLNGRRTVWDDPFKPGRNGLVSLAQRIEINSPVALVILMLGTNDFQSSHPQNDAFAASLGIAALVNAIRTAPIEPGMPVPPILIVSPPHIQTPQGAIAPKFRGSEQRSAGLDQALRQIASDLKCHFFDAQTATTTSPLDGVHLDAPQHLQLGEAITPVIHSILSAADSNR